MKQIFKRLPQVYELCTSHFICILLNFFLKVYIAKCHTDIMVFCWIIVDGMQNRQTVLFSATQTPEVSRS